MAYLGNDLQVAFPVYRNIDDISGSFNSSTTSFPLTVSGVAPIPAPLYSQQCLISVGGVVQRPDDSGTEGFRLSGGNIIFASAPTTGADFFGVILAGADYINAGGNFPSGTAGVPSITFNDDLDTGIYNSGINQLSITTGGSERLRIDSAGQIESVSLGTAAAPAFSFTTDPNTGIYSPGADQVAISTNGTGRLFVNSSGSVGVNTNTFQVIGTNIVPLEIKGNAADRSGALVLSTSNASQYAWHYFAAGNYYMGTATNNDIAFVRNGSELMRLASTGLGLGTSAPGAKLTVAQSAANADTDGIRIIDSGATTRANLYYRGSQVFEINSASNPGGADVETLRLSTIGNARLSITRDGSVGVGTNSPNGLLALGFADASSASLEFRTTSYSNLAQIVASNPSSDTGEITFRTRTGGSAFDRAKIDGSGRLLVGTSSAQQAGSVTANLQVAGTTAGSSSISAIRHSADANPPYITLGKSRGSLNGVTAVVNNDLLGYIEFAGANGTDISSIAARISAEVDGEVGTAGDTTDMPGRLVFSTTADGTSSPTERMRITNDGAVYIHATSLPGAGTSTTGVGISSNDALTVHRAAATACFFGRSNDGEVIALYSGTTQRGTVSIAGATTTYGSVSDYRLKENIQTILGALETVSKLKPKTFNFIEFPEQSINGFIAHEVQEVVPEAVIGEKDAVKEDGSPLYQSIDQSKLVPLLTAALQEAVAKIESLEARLTAAGI